MEVWRNRVVATLLSLLIVFGSRLGAAGARFEESWSYAAVLALGYGHILGSFAFGWPRLRRATRNDRLGASLLVSSTLSFLAFFSWAIQRADLYLPAVAALGAISLWHIIENDLALARAYRCGLVIGAVRSSHRDQRPTLAVASVLVIAVAATTTGARLIPASSPPLVAVPEIAASVLLYHVFTWLLFFLDRSARLDPERARRHVVGLGAVHLTPLAVMGISYHGAPALYAHLATPAVYLLWSFTHVAHTTGVRLIDRRA